MSEKLFENKIKKLFKERGIWFFKVWGGGVFQKSGIPDLIACVNGRFVALEVKDEKGRPSNLQTFVIHQIKKAGGYARLIYPSEFDELVFDIDEMLSQK